MCAECGCGDPTPFQVLAPGNAEGRHRHFDTSTGTWYEHDHAHDHAAEHAHAPHDHSHPHDHAAARTIATHTSLLSLNDRIAERNRGFFEAHQLRAVNFMSSPGAGKTTLLQATLTRLAGKTAAAVLVGDLATDLDGARLQGHGAEVLQITTGTACHLDAEMVHAAASRLNLQGIRLLLIENVGNLVCPASFDLGEAARVVLFSTTEGEDKPLKYPPMFKKADAVLITKTDLAEAAGFDMDKARHVLAEVAPQARHFELSSRTGDGMDAWTRWLIGA